LGNNEEAIKCVNSALDINPYFTEAIELKKELMEKIPREERITEQTIEINDKPVVISIEEVVKEEVNGLFKNALDLVVN